MVQDEMYQEENGARKDVPRILILLTDGSQTQAPDAEDPGRFISLKNKCLCKRIVNRELQANPINPNTEFQYHSRMWLKSTDRGLEFTEFENWDGDDD